MSEPEKTTTTNLSFESLFYFLISSLSPVLRAEKDISTLLVLQSLTRQLNYNSLVYTDEQKAKVICITMQSISDKA